MGASAQATIDFGPWPGKDEASVVITGQTGIAADSEVEAWLMPANMAAGWTADGAYFDGLTTDLSRIALVGAPTTKLGIFSGWVRYFRTSVSQYLLWSDPTFNGRFECYVAPQLGFEDGPRMYATGASGFDATFTAGFGLINQPAYLPGQWRHILCSWDIGLNVGSMYVDDVLIDSTPGRAADEAINWALANIWRVGYDGSTRMNGGLAEIYFNPGQYLDFSVQANRRKFNQVLLGDNALRPVSLGTDGSTPTATVPLVYLHLDHSEAGANFATNRGSGGNFTITGKIPRYGLPVLLSHPHDEDDHVEGPKVWASKSSIVVGTGFTINGIAADKRAEEPLGLYGGRAGDYGRTQRLYGTYNVGWAWN